MVESGGVQKLAAMIPPKPITETSSGTLTPRSRQARSASTAIVTMSQKRAVGRSERDRKEASASGDDCVAGFDARNVLIENTLPNAACNALRLGAANLLVHNCCFVGPGEYPHILEGMHHMHAAALPSRATTTRSTSRRPRRSAACVPPAPPRAIPRSSRMGRTPT